MGVCVCVVGAGAHVCMYVCVCVYATRGDPWDWLHPTLGTSPLVFPPLSFNESDHL